MEPTMHVPKLEPYLSFDGNCAEAFKFYEKVLGAKIEGLTTYGDRMKERCPSADANNVMHGVLRLGSQLIRASDRMTEQPYEAIKGCWLSLDYPTAAAAKQVFAALSEGGKITMQIDKTFWASAFGMVTDRFGVPWMVSCNGEA
jgi:PhnB protein